MLAIWQFFSGSGKKLWERNVLVSFNFSQSLCGLGSLHHLLTSMFSSCFNLATWPVLHGLPPVSVTPVLKMGVGSRAVFDAMRVEVENLLEVCSHFV